MATIVENTPVRAVVVFTKAGQPGIVDGPPVWSMEPPDAASMTVSPDGMFVDILWTKAGAAVLKVLADGNMTDEVSEVSATVDLEFLPSTVGADAAEIQFVVA